MAALSNRGGKSGLHRAQRLPSESKSGRGDPTESATETNSQGDGSGLQALGSRKAKHPKTESREPKALPGNGEMVR